jgi:hypothetical protein
MGNYFETNNKNNDIIEQQQKLDEIFNSNQINQITKYNLLCFNPEITFEYYRQTKSYFEQLRSMDKNQLLSSEYNELYIGQLGINIENNGNVIFIEPKDLKRKYKIMSSNHGNYEEHIYKYCEFEFIEDNTNTNNFNTDNTDNTDIESMKKSIKKIKEYEEKIEELNRMIVEEKYKIKDTNYVKSRINKSMSDVSKYISNVNKYLDDFNK